MPDLNRPAIKDKVKNLIASLQDKVIKKLEFSVQEFDKAQSLFHQSQNVGPFAKSAPHPGQSHAPLDVSVIGKAIKTQDKALANLIVVSKEFNLLQGGFDKIPGSVKTKLYKAVFSLNSDLRKLQAQEPVLKPHIEKIWVYAFQYNWDKGEGYEVLANPNDPEAEKPWGKPKMKIFHPIEELNKHLVRLNQEANKGVVPLIASLKLKIKTLQAELKQPQIVEHIIARMRGQKLYRYLMD